MVIQRRQYLEKLIIKKENGYIKVITGVRRCGKSYLLFNLYHEYLNTIGVDDANIIKLPLDEAINARYRNPLELDSHIRELVANKHQMYYVFLDEIQKVLDIQNPYIDDTNAKIGFVDVLLGLMKIKNVDLYVTGSNSRMLSSDIITEFRDRGDEIRIYPLTYKEFYNAFSGEKRYAWREYYTYGGMPAVMARQTHEEKSKYLKDLFDRTYLTDVVERHRILNDKEVLEELLNIVASAIGSLTNPTKLSKTYKSVKNKSITPTTISTYLDYFVNAFILNKAYRYDIKGKKYIDTPLKYYYCDVGLRNAWLKFRQQEENHIMENILYNELVSRGFDVDVGVVQYNYRNADGKSKRSQLEVDFVVNKSSQRYYIQSALSVADEEKRNQEISSLCKISDSFRRIVVVRDDIIPWHDDNGILYIGIEQFLLNYDMLDV